MSTQPGQRSNQIKQFRTIKIGPRLTIGLSAGKERCPGSAKGDARCVERGIGIFDGAHHRLNNATMFIGEGDNLLQPQRQGFG